MICKAGQWAWEPQRSDMMWSSCGNHSYQALDLFFDFTSFFLQILLRECGARQEDSSLGGMALTLPVRPLPRNPASPKRPREWEEMNFLWGLISLVHTVSGSPPAISQQVGESPT